MTFVVVVHVPGNGFQDQLLRYLPRDQSEANWPVVPWVLLFVLFEARSDIVHIPTVSAELEGECRDTVIHKASLRKTGYQKDDAAAV